MTVLTVLRCENCNAKLCEFDGDVKIKCKRCKSLVEASTKST